MRESSGSRLGLHPVHRVRPEYRRNAVILVQNHAGTRASMHRFRCLQSTDRMTLLGRISLPASRSADAGKPESAAASSSVSRAGTSSCTCRHSIGPSSGASDANHALGAASASRSTGFGPIRRKRDEARCCGGGGAINASFNCGRWVRLYEPERVCGESVSFAAVSTRRQWLNGLCLDAISAAIVWTRPPKCYRRSRTRIPRQ